MSISELIDKQDTFELVRDEIAAILATEVASQMALAVTAGKDPDDWKLRVFSERSNPWEQMLNQQTDRSPIVSVWFDSTSFNMASGNVVDRQNAEGVFNIDCYGFGFSADDGAAGHVAGDKEAALEAHRALRLVRNILMAAEYTYLNLRGLVGRRWTQSITAFQPDIGAQQMPKTAGARLALSVVFNEFSPQVPSQTLELVSASVKRQETGEVVVEADYVYPLQDPCFQPPIPNRSMDFASSKFLELSDANFGAFDRSKFAISLWYKIATIGANRYLWTQGSGLATFSFLLRLNTSNKLEVFAINGGSIDGQLITTATYTDFANWHHILYHFDSANATPGDRMKLWHDGAEITAFDTDTNPTAAVQDSASTVVIGSDSNGTSNFFNGKLFQTAFFSGSLPAIGDLYNAGSPKDLTALTGLYSLLNTNDVDALEDDFVLATDWVNNGGVSKDVDIP